MFSIVSCSPRDVAMPNAQLSSSSPAYAGFTGATAAQTVAATKVKVTWTPSADPNVVAYNIYDATLFFAPKLVKTVTGSMSEATITGLTTANYYSFRVRAADKDNKEDGNTKGVGAIPYAGVLPAEVQSATSAKIPFTDGSNADAVNIFCTTLTNPIEELMATVTDTTSVTYATLTGLTAGTVYTCRAALQIGEFIDNNTVKTTFTPMGTASSLSFTTQPGSAAAAANLSTQPVVKILDSNGTIVSAGPDSTAIITLTVSANSPTVGSIRGTSAVQAVKGVATFSGLNFYEAGAKILTATKEDTSSQNMGSGPLSADSSQFTITPGAVSPTTSTIAISPAVPPNAALIANGSNSYTVTITLADNYGNFISGVKPVFASNLSGDTLTQPTANTGTNGQSSGSISTTLADTSAPYRMLSISSPSGLTSVMVAAPFVPGTATKLAFTTQPTNSPGGMNGMGTVRVAVQDAQGNVVNTGAGSTAAISMAINANVGGAILYGTTTVNAVNGVATFSDLGIDKTATGYKLLATSGSYTAAYSNSFNITAGTPQKIVIAGATSVISGACSAAITFQLKDNGNNLANAVQNTPINISGLGTGALYASSSCTGAPATATQTFTAGTNTKTLYLKDNKGEALTITASDPSAVLLTGTLSFSVAPNKVSLLAQAPVPPNAPGTLLSVVAGQCSAPIVVTPTGENGVAAPLFAATTVAITGVSGTGASIYTDAGCTNSVSANSVPLPITAGTGTYTINVYLKDDKSENLSLSVTDPNSIMSTSSGLQSVSILSSDIGFTGPTSVVSGACSSAFTISLKDKQSNLVPAPANRTLTIHGLEASTTGMFYPSAACSTGGSKTSITIPASNSSMQVFFKNTTAETNTIYLSDSLSLMADSPSITIGVSPSALRITAPAPANSNTGVCAGPFTVNTMDGANNVTAAIAPITVNLTGAGTGGTFFTSNTCSTSTTQLTFSTGNSAKTFYFKGQAPQASLTFTASDSGAVLTSGTASWTVIAAQGFIGTAGTTKDGSNNTLWFTQGVVPIAARQDAQRGVSSLEFDSTGTYLYVVDPTMDRVLKYNYATHQYIGWIGGFWSGTGIGISGSNLATPSNALCASVSSNGQALPGWCYGGLSTAVGNTTNGAMYDPTDVATDDTYVYVVNRSSDTVNRYNAATGAFDGWIGRIATTPTGVGTGGPAACTSTAAGNVTPGWCKGGDRQGQANVGTGAMNGARAIAYAGGYLYVSTQGAILRFNSADGSFQGWVGIVGATPPTGGAANCTTRGNGQITPGWCFGGTNQTINPRSSGGGGVNDPTGIQVIGNTLYVMHIDSGGTVTTYNASTGAYTGMLPNLSSNWSSPRQFTTDGTNFYVADWTRMIQVDTTGLVLGWVGKVNNNSSMSGNAGCSTLSPNDNTPGFCLGGSAKAGVDEQAFNELTAIAYDQAGNVVTGQGGTFPAIKIWNATTGVYGGTLGAQSTSPTEWSNDNTIAAQYYGFDDNSMYTPGGMYNDGTYLYLVESDAARVKKISVATGSLVGWIGGITTVPTGGAAGCTSANAMGITPGWCLGALFNPNYLWNLMIPQATSGLMRYPVGITGDGTNLFVVDREAQRILKYDQGTGDFVGWIGQVSSTPPTGGDAGCVGAAQGTFTPGWCTGGLAQAGTSDGALNNPTAITTIGGNIYVVDSSNHRVNSYNSTTGVFNGWIGRTNAAPTSNCTVASNGSYNVSVSGWCKGGTAQSASSNDRGGGFAFWSNSKGGITNDGTYLYVSNLYNIRVDKYSLAGVWQGAASTRHDNYTRVWSNNAVTVSGWGGIGCSYPVGIWVNSTHMYGMAYNTCSNGNATAVWKLTMTTGTLLGWQGGIRAGNSPTGGDTGCAGATINTPGWCQGGVPDAGYRLGQFSGNAYGVTGDTNFIYISDENAHRVTRIPK